MKKITLLLLLNINFNNLQACITCNPTIKEGINKSLEDPGIIKILPAFVVLLILVIALVLLTYKNIVGKERVSSSIALMAATTIIGIGLGGFVDGILFHQILQWHEMLSHKIPSSNFVNKSVNMFWDGIFHGFTLTVTMLGIYRSFIVQDTKNIIKTRSILFAGFFLGWGIFNLVEGIINHQILQLHNVKEASENPDVWNVSFLFFGMLLVIIGFIMFKKLKLVLDEKQKDFF